MHQENQVAESGVDTLLRERQVDGSRRALAKIIILCVFRQANDLTSHLLAKIIIDLVSDVSADGLLMREEKLRRGFVQDTNVQLAVLCFKPAPGENTRFH